MTEVAKPQTKTDLAKKLGVSRSSLYYKHKRPAVDEEVKRQIEAVLVNHPAYGHKRIALELKLNKKRILRVMKKFGIKPYRRRVHPIKKDDLGKAPSHHLNLICEFCPIVPDVVWVADFTYIRFHEYFIYVATYMDLYSREIVGWHISRYHTSSLVLAAWEHALTNSKLDLGDPNRFEELGEFIEAINQTIVEYNEGRIHTTLKMNPANFRRLRDKQLSTQVKDKSSSEKGT